MNCLNCGKELIKAQTKYCCNKCQKEYESKQKVQAWLAGDFNGNSGYQLSKTIRNYLLKSHDYKCEKCGWGEKNSFTDLIPLEIHHKDGDYKNNRPENLEVLCPNCHSLTSNFRNNGEGRPDRISSSEKPTIKKCIDCGKEIFITSTRCQACEAKRRQAEKPVSREDLKKLIRTESFTSIGNKFNVSDAAIKKWCKGYNLPFRKKDINVISDEDWEKI